MALTLPRPPSFEPATIGHTLSLAFDQLEAYLRTLGTGTSPLTTKGDVYTHDATVDARLAVGADATVLTADSTQATGIKWAAPAGGAPSGPAGGDLTGTYPNPTIDVLKVTDAKVAAANKDGLAATPSMRTLGAGAAQACAGNDSRLSDSRPPNGVAGGDLAGSYPNPTVKASVGLTGVPTSPTAAVDTNTPQIATTAFVLAQAASGAGLAPLMDGIAAIGVSTRYARADHVHPSDTSKVSTTDARLTAEAYDPGTVTIPTENFRLHYRHLKLAGVERLTLEGTAEVVLREFDAYAPATLIMGTPKLPLLPFTVPTDYFLLQAVRLSLAGSTRATLQGTADLLLTDDFGTRSRIVLAGGST